MELMIDLDQKIDLDHLQTTMSVHDLLLNLKDLCDYNATSCGEIICERRSTEFAYWHQAIDEILEHLNKKSLRC
jgi:hypothetical protein